jgi:hypothetical protein
MHRQNPPLTKELFFILVPFFLLVQSMSWSKNLNLLNYGINKNLIQSQIFQKLLHIVLQYHSTPQGREKKIKNPKPNLYGTEETKGPSHTSLTATSSPLWTLTPETNQMKPL